MNRRDHQAGVTLVETAVVLVLGVVVTLSMLGLERTSTDLTLGSIAESDLDLAANQALVRLGSELRWARSATLLITTENGSDRVDFVVSEGHDGTAAVWSAPIIVRYEPSTSDANGNGVADEGRLVRIASGVERTLCRNVAQGGFALTRNDDMLQLALTVFARAGGRLVQRVVRHSETLVNGG